MMAGCSVAPAVDRAASDVIGYLDCQAQTLGAGGFQALAAPGSSVSLALTTLLTIFVAIIGYRLLFGERPGTRDLSLSAIKVGAVLAFTTSWAAYQPVVYDLILYGPAQLAAELSNGAGLATTGLTQRIDMIDRSIASLAILGVGTIDSALSLSPQAAAPSWFIGFDAFALGLTRSLFLASTVGGFAIVRIGAGLLLALGPLFVAAALFDATRWLFAGWVRALVAVALGALAVTVTLAIQLALLEPWLTELLSQRYGGDLVSGAPGALLAMTAMFAMTSLAMLILSGFVAAGLPLSLSRVEAARHGPRAAEQGLNQTVGMMSAGRAEERSRALQVADAVAAAQRRERAAPVPQTAGLAGSMSAARDVSAAMPATLRAASAATGRRTTLRISQSARNRDRGL